MKEELKTIIAAFLAIFVVLSPAAHNMSQDLKISIPDTIDNTETQLIEEASLVGHQAPGLELEYLNGEKTALKDFEGKTLVLYIWSTWSPPSPGGIWFINQLHAENQHKELVVLAANVGFRDQPEIIQRFIKGRNFEVPVALCTGDVMTQLNIRSFPAIFIIDKQGLVQYQDTGLINEKEFRRTLEEILDPVQQPSGS